MEIIQKCPVTRFCLSLSSEKHKLPCRPLSTGDSSTGLTRFKLVNAGVKVLFRAFSPILPHHGQFLIIPYFSGHCGIFSKGITINSKLLICANIFIFSTIFLPNALLCLKSGYQPIKSSILCCDHHRVGYKENSFLCFLIILTGCSVLSYTCKISHKRSSSLILPKDL